MKLEVGIDLGTTNTVAAYANNGTIEFVRFRNSESITSTLLYQGGKVTIGEVAKRKSAIYPSNFIKSSKSSIGDNDQIWHIEDREFTPTDVAHEVLIEVVKTIKKSKPEISELEAVITVPAYFQSNQIEETKKAAERAGLKIKKILTEPVSAALAYGFEEHINQKLFIVDIGGGTFDTAVLEIKDGLYQTHAIDGDSKLGGDNFDKCILDILLKHLRKDAGRNFSSLEKSGLEEQEYRRALQALINKSEEVKIDLSEYEEVDVELANLFNGYNLSLTITRDEFEKESRTLINKIKRTIEQTIFDTGIKPTEIDKVVLVGGSSKIPAIRNFVTEYFNQPAYSDKPLDKLVAMGAAIYAHSGNTVQIADILSHSLGTDTAGDQFSVIIPKNSVYPTSRSHTYTTPNDFQEVMGIRIFEGEDQDVRNNFFHGKFTLSGIQKAKAREPKIVVTFAIDENRVLTVTAVDKNTGSNISERLTINKSNAETATLKRTHGTLSLKRRGLQ